MLPSRPAELSSPQKHNKTPRFRHNKNFTSVVKTHQRSYSENDQGFGLPTNTE